MIIDRFFLLRLFRALFSPGLSLRHLHLLPVFCLAAMLHHGGAAAQTADYRLGPQDKIRLKVYEWRATVDAVFEWSSLNGEFTLGASGAISVPLIGEIPAAGETTSGLAVKLGERLMQRIGLSQAPDIAVEVTQYRPFYILGGVNKPGEYPYRPGLTVLQAVSLAGGLGNSGESSRRVNREVISSQGELTQLANEANVLLARKSRLESEKANLENVAFPPELEENKDDPAIDVLLTQETAIFDARQTALTTQMGALEQLKEFLDKEVESLQAQIGAQKKEEDLLSQELDKVKSLVQRGLAPSTRQLELERIMSRMDGDRLKLESTLLKARQDISRTDISIIEVRNKRSNDIATELRETQTRLEQAVAKYATTQALLSDTQSLSPELLAAENGELQPIYYLVRASASGQKESKVEDSAKVEPGDTVKVRLPRPRGLGIDPTAATAIIQ